MALAWTVTQKGITSALIGVSKLSQLISNLKALENTDFSKEELELIDAITI
jgi:L-glyceraldehyde 3-phosphate reductase